MPDRLRTFCLTISELGDLALGRRVLVNVPDDAELVAVHTPQDRHDMAHLLFRHPSFELVYSGDCYIWTPAHLGYMTVPKEALNANP